MMIERHGMALPLILLLLLALTAFGHGALMLSRRELQATWAFRNLVRAGQAAELGLRLALEVTPDPAEDRTPWVANPLLSGETDDGLVYGVSRRWLDGEFFLLEGWGGTRGWVGARKTGWIGWSLFPRVRMRAFLAAAEVGSELVQEDRGSLGLGEFLRPPDGWSASECEAYRSLLDSLSSGGPLPPVAVGVRMEVSQVAPGSSIPSLGLLTGAELLLRAEKRGQEALPASSRGTIRGCPDTGGPVFVGTPGTFTLSGGRLCGLLVTGGDLRISGDAKFQGLALVGGNLILEDQATFEGFARVRKSLHLRGEGVFSGSACASLRALTGVPALGPPLLIQRGVGADQS